MVWFIVDRFKKKIVANCNAIYHPIHPIVRPTRIWNSIKHHYHPHRPPCHHRPRVVEEMDTRHPRHLRRTIAFSLCVFIYPSWWYRIKPPVCGRPRGVKVSWPRRKDPPFYPPIRRTGLGHSRRIHRCKPITIGLRSAPCCKT